MKWVTSGHFPLRSWRRSRPRLSCFFGWWNSSPPRPGHGKGTPTCVFFHQTKWGSNCWNLAYRWDIYLYDIKYDLKCISMNGTEMAYIYIYIYIIIYVYTPTTCPFWWGKLWWTIQCLRLRFSDKKNIVSDRKMTIESCYFALLRVAVLSCVQKVQSNEHKL